MVFMFGYCLKTRPHHQNPMRALAAMLAFCAQEAIRPLPCTTGQWFRSFDIFAVTLSEQLSCGLADEIMRLTHRRDRLTVLCQRCFKRMTHARMAQFTHRVAIMSEWYRNIILTCNIPLLLICHPHRNAIAYRHWNVEYCRPDDLLHHNG